MKETLLTIGYLCTSETPVSAEVKNQLIFFLTDITLECLVGFESHQRVLSIRIHAPGSLLDCLWSSNSPSP